MKRRKQLGTPAIELAQARRVLDDREGRCALPVLEQIDYRLAAIRGGGARTGLDSDHVLDAIREARDTPPSRQRYAERVLRRELQNGQWAGEFVLARRTANGIGWGIERRVLNELPHQYSLLNLVDYPLMANHTQERRWTGQIVRKCACIPEELVALDKLIEAGTKVEQKKAASLAVACRTGGRVLSGPDPRRRRPSRKRSAAGR